MSTDSETLEVDPDELSDEVIEDLVEEGGLEKKEAESLGDEVWFEEVDTGEPSKTGAVSYVKGRFNLGKESASDLRTLFSDYKTILADIESVERTDRDRVEIKIRHGRIGTETVTFSPGSTELANILEWRGVSNPRELEGLSIPILRESFDSRYTHVLIPHNVSSTGRLRFSLYNGIEEIREKTKISKVHKDPDDFIFGSGIALIITLFLTIPAIIVQAAGLELLASLLTLPLVLNCVAIGFLIFYGLFRGSLRVLSGVFDSDYKETRCR